jgi:hypothetical protein
VIARLAIEKDPSLRPGKGPKDKRLVVTAGARAMVAGRITRFLVRALK